MFLMKPIVNLLFLEGVPIFEQLALEEALFRADHENWCLVNSGSTPAIVMGLSGNADDAVDMRLWDRDPIPIIKRFSGGGTVVVDEDTLFCTFIMRSGDVSCESTPASVMTWSHQIYAHAFSPIPLQLQEHDYAIEGRKVGGNAQCFAGGRFLHHTSFLWNYSQERMQLLRHPTRQPQYRSDRTHEAFCTAFKQYFPSKEKFFSAFVNSIEKTFFCRKVSREGAENALSRPHRKNLVIFRQ